VVIIIWMIIMDVGNASSSSLLASRFDVTVTVNAG
jgi:hypothetical protein